MQKLLILAAVLNSSFAALFAVVYAQGFEDIGSFQTPSANTFCIATRDTRTNSAYLQCELNENTAKIPAQPKDCNLDWGNRFGLGMRGKAERECHGDTIQNPNYKKLEYGQSWQVTGFKCDLTRVRLRCMNLDKRGFELAKSRQILF